MDIGLRRPDLSLEQKHGKLMIFNDRRGNLRNIERFESLPCCHS